MISRILTTVLLFVAPLQETKQEVDKPVPPSTPFVEHNERQFTFYPGGKLQIIARAPGNVKVIGWQRSSIMLQTERIVYRLEPEQARKLAGQYPVQVRWTQTTAKIQTSGPPQSAADMELNLVVYVPKEKTDISINMINGDLAIGVINGWVEATLEEGNIEAKSLAGYFSGLTKHGNVDAAPVGKHWDGHGFTGVTQSGEVVLHLPPDYSAALQLETRAGNISIDYPKQLVDGEEVPLTAAAKKNARTLTATVGAGGAPIRLMTFSGDVKLVTSSTP